jgi:predicted ArsR family transcriptional regulator
VDRVSVPEAAQRLGVTQDAVRKRIHRDAIGWEQDADGRYYVYLEDTGDTTRTTSRERRHDTQAKPREGERDMLIEFLRSELAAWQEEARRKDHIIAALTERIPELEAPASSAPESRESPVTVSGEPGRRSWWRAFFGLE